MKTVAKGAEAKLMEIVGSLRSSPAGYYGLHYHLSRLRPEFRSDYQIKIATNILNDLFKALDSIAFMMQNGDIILLYNGVNRGLLEKAIFQLRYLFMDDPLGYTDDGFENADFCTVYDLEFQWRDFFVSCQRHLNQGEIIPEEDISSDNKIVTATGNRKRLHVFSPEYLVTIVNEVENVDISPTLRSQPICALVGSKEPRVLFKEVYTNISHLQELLAIDVDFMSNKALFKYLTEVLDKQVLQAANENSELTTAPISLNLNIKTLFTEEFARFDASIAKNHKSSIIIEINIADVFEDIGKFILAKTEVQKLGYRICLDGLDETSFMQIDRQGLGFDLAKVKWNTEMDKHGSALSEAVKKCGANRIILCWCDNQTAIDYGKSIGISLFQGRFVDNLVDAKSTVVN
jgi:hypothetical protein